MYECCVEHNSSLKHMLVKYTLIRLLEMAKSLHSLRQKIGRLWRQCAADRLLPGRFHARIGFYRGQLLVVWFGLSSSWFTQKTPHARKYILGDISFWCITCGVYSEVRSFEKPERTWWKLPLNALFRETFHHLTFEWSVGSCEHKQRES